MNQTYTAVTSNIRVEVVPDYLEERSDPSNSQWFWSYTISIANEGVETVQLVSRDWTITDSTGHIDRVNGPGVVGEQPVLRSGDAFRYSSGCPLKTSSGFMAGFFIFVDEAGQSFKVNVPTFALDVPGQARALN